jgi:hypothetical protein
MERRRSRRMTIIDVPPAFEDPSAAIRKRLSELRASMLSKLESEKGRRAVNERIAQAQGIAELRHRRRESLLDGIDAKELVVARSLSRFGRRIGSYCSTFEDFQQMFRWVSRSYNISAQILEDMGVLRLTQMRDAFSKMRQELSSQMEKEIVEIRESHSLAILELQRGISLMENGVEENKSLFLQEFHAQKGDKKNRYLEEMNHLRVWMDASVDQVDEMGLIHALCQY